MVNAMIGYFQKKFQGRARLAEVGTIPMIFTAAEFGAYIAAESEKWAKVVKFAGIKPESPCHRCLD
jgi:hypothetical protein